MRIYTVDTNHLDHVLREELLRANVVINNDVRMYVENYDGPFNDVLKKNIEVAEKLKLPLCQDTGMVEFFVFANPNVVTDKPIEFLLNDIVRKLYRENPFRYSVVEDPLFERKNTFDNTPCIVHIFQTELKTFQIHFLIKGGGSENLTRLFMLNPTIGKQEIINLVVQHISENGAKACPPLKIGIGIGGSAEKAVILSKLALIRKFGERNVDRNYAQLEKELCEKINSLKIGFQGLHAGPTVYDVHIEQMPTHIAVLPVAVSVDCYLCRGRSVEIELSEIECR